MKFASTRNNLLGEVQCKQDALSTRKSILPPALSPDSYISVVATMNLASSWIVRHTSADVKTAGSWQNELGTSFSYLDGALFQEDVSTDRWKAARHPHMSL